MQTIEIFATGKWNGMVFDNADLDNIVSAFDELSAVHDVPLKFGHNDEQPMTDGQPALGWVDKIFVEGKKLKAKLKDVPEIVEKAIQKKLYKKVSVELDIDVDYKEKKFPYVLSGVALLGADIPAVNVLKDLAQYFKSDIDSNKHLTFTAIEVTNMSEELQKQISDLQAQLNSVKEDNNSLKLEKGKLEAEQLQFKKNEEDRKEAELKALFEKDQEIIKSDLESLVKDGLITPAQRDHFTKDLTRENISQVKFSVEGLKLGQKKEPAKSPESGKKEEGEPDQILLSRISKLQLENPSLAFSKAKEAVLKADKELAKEYILMNEV